LFLLNDNSEDHFTIITPKNVAERGCQLSIMMKKNGRKVFDSLVKSGVIADWREPDVIRVAPVPLYNTFGDVFRFAEIFNSALKASDRLKRSDA
jgi:kynureninase